MHYCCWFTLIAKVAGPLLSRVTWVFLKLLVLLAQITCFWNKLIAVFLQYLYTNSNDGIRDFYVIILYPLHYCVYIITVGLGNENAVAYGHVTDIVILLYMFMFIFFLYLFCCATSDGEWRFSLSLLVLDIF